jgi:membrane protease YdiL (CAAX protease family)
MDLILVGLVLAGLIIIANLFALRGSPAEMAVFRWFLFAMNLLLLLAGLGLFLTPVTFWEELIRESGEQVINAENLKAMGPAVIFMAFWGMATTLAPVQRLLARLMPLQPGSPVHTLALVLAGYLVGITLLTLGQGGLEALAEASESASIGTLIIQGVFFVALAFLGVGLFIRRNGRQLLQRLGLERPTTGQLRQGVGWILLLLLLQFIAGALFTWLNPDQAATLEDVNSVLLQDFDTVGEWLVLALIAGISEEILFRGALQPIFGLWFTSILFAVVHVQYGLTPVTVFVVILAVLLGLIRRRTPLRIGQ